MAEVQPPLSRDEQAKLLQLAAEDFLRRYPEVPADDVPGLMEQALRDGQMRAHVYTNRVVLVFQGEEFYSIDPHTLKLAAHTPLN